MATTRAAVVTCFYLGIVYANPQVYFEKVKYHYEPSTVSGKTWLTGNRTINFRLNLTRNLRTVDLMFNINMKIRGTAYIPLINVTTSYCDKAKKISANPLTRVINKSFLSTTNFPQDCPIPKNQYYVKDYRFPQDLLPKSIPKVGFRTETTLTFRNEMGEPRELFHFEIFGRITDG